MFTLVEYSAAPKYWEHCSQKLPYFPEKKVILFQELRVMFWVACWINYRELIKRFALCRVGAWAWQHFVIKVKRGNLPAVEGGLSITFCVCFSPWKSLSKMRHNLYDCFWDSGWKKHSYIYVWTSGGQDTLLSCNKSLDASSWSQTHRLTITMTSSTRSNCGS